jgi:hypothetical protein
MTPPSWWRFASVVALAALGARALWVAWDYYFQTGPRYRVESAMIALVAAGVIVVVLRRGGAHQVAAAAAVPRAALPLLLAGAVVFYGRAIGLGLLSDDYTLRAMAESGSVGGDGWFFRPLPLLLWRAAFAVVDAPALLHFINVLLHGVNAYLVAVLGCAMGMRREHALSAAFMFLVFPALPEAVAWTAGIQDVLMTTMALATVVVAGRGADGRSRIAIVCTLFVLGLGAKETAVCIPILIVLCWLSPARLRSDARLYAALALVAIAYLAIRTPMGIGNDYLATPTRYFFKQLIVVAFGTLAAPWRDPAVLLDRMVAFTAVVMLVLAFVHAGLSWQRGDAQVSRDARLALWVLASIAPVSTLFFVGPTLEGSRYLYLAAGAWSLVLVDLLASVAGRLGRPSLAFGVAATSVALVFALSLQRELAVWQRAADLRDRVLAEAQVVFAETPCDRPTFANVPDSVDGAYVFRNGFPEAVGLADGAASVGAAECQFAWTGRGFRRVP